MAYQNPFGRERGRGSVTHRGALAMGAGHFNDGVDAHDSRDIEIERLQQRFNPFGGPHQGHRDGKFRDDPLRGICIKVEIPEFAGKSHPDDFIEWLSAVERILDLKEIPDSHSVEETCLTLVGSCEETMKE
ncbi:hypothetical protein Tco_0804642 [Tanacetum coccineum]|uniref:Uncharacterized protein n=1 Tax=Tanacetum coccineum TaxID=301880 RepID=A0ABQ5A4V3_9ASTR